MNKILAFLILISITVSCNNGNSKRIPLAKAGNSILYIDQLKGIIPSGTSDADSTVLVKNYINK